MASSTTETVQSYFSSPCSKPQPENDVFLSFRGKDTRDNFTDHLYRALKVKKIKTFKDDTELELGKPISPNLLEAIEKSRIAVVILSENYAYSPWCLDELVKIIECKERGLRVLPVFYHVEPKIVRQRTEAFAKALAEHENRFQKEQVDIWRKALIDVANLSGKTLTNGPEGEFVEETVDWIFTELKDKSSIVDENDFVGAGSRVKEMISLLDMNLNDVRFIGICGKSGMGKTTLARFVFDKICNQFEACSFLENVKEVSKACGLETLQEQLLCDISKGVLRVRTVSRGIRVIKNILRVKKVLIVVDDVSEKRHLEALAGKNWFGPRSRIIVTTEDERLLKNYKIQTVFKADGLNNDEAQKLFSHKAHCEIDFLDLGNDFVTYAQGSPLVLKVLGSHLCKRTKEEWETARNQLKDILNENIPVKLQIAYNGLEELEKKLFLHIACFFKGEDQNRVAAILESVCYSDDNIRKLIDKSLITIAGEKLCMHHLIQQMGWNIVCRESTDPERRSRLWDCTEVLKVLKNNIGTERIEGMILNLPPNEEQEELYVEPFSKMNKLKLLKICKLQVPCLSSLSNELLLLEWHEYPLKSLPKSFQPPELVELIMHHSGIRQLPSEFSNLHKLKRIDLSDSRNLCQTPNFNGLPNIERLIFQGCTGLQSLHPSVGGLERLILLNLKDCTRLEKLPHEINLNSLKILILSGCSKLKKFPKIGRNMTSMLELYLDRTAIEELPSSIKHLTSLTLLNLQDCENLSSFPSVICSLVSLEILILSGCKGQLPKAMYLSGLTPTLYSIGTTLTLPYTYLTDRQTEPEPSSLVLPESFSGLSSLESLDLSGCNMLDGALPDELSYLSSLTSLNLRNNNFTHLPNSISQLSNLKLLFLDHCSKLQSLPYLPLSTQFVSAQGCTSLEIYSNQVVVWTLDAVRFTFINCHGLADDEEGKIADVPLLNTHFQSLWQRYMEDQIHQLKGFCLVVPQTKISEWFNKKECGSSVRIPLPPNLFNNRSWKGIALCVIFVVPPALKDESPGQDSKYFHEFICHFDMDGVSLNCPLVLKVPKETFVGSFGLWLYISHARFTEHSDKGSCIGFVIRPTRPNIQIKMCGTRILCEQDMIEFVQNSRQENFRSCNDLSQGHEKFIEDHMSSSQSSDPKLKQKLHSQLSTLYQVDCAQKHLYDYIFHQIACPPRWFACKELGPSIEMQLPPDVHDNSKWLGITIYALYGIQMQPAGSSYKLDLTIFLCSSDEVSLAPHMVFPFSRDVSDESPQDSQRLVVFYIPRQVFQLNECNIGASFKSGDTAVLLESCGIRLVYEQNVAEFVQALVECMLGSPESNHQSFSEHLSHQLGMLQDCNHEKDYRCPFLPGRRPNPVRMLLRNNETIQEESTSWETLSNQVIAAGTSKNSGPGSINLGLSFGNGQCGSKMSGIRECWFKPYLQNHHKCSSAFNRCSPQSEIPKWFTKQITGSSMRILLPSNLYYKPDWIGFAISAVFSSHKNPTTARMKQGSGFSHMVICHLKTNLGCMNPLLYYGIREEHVLTSLHQREFLWESIISHRLLSPEWSECTWVEFLFVSDSSDVSALKCAVDLVYRDNLQDFTLTMAPCITSYNDPFTSNERLPLYHRDKSNDSDGLYEDQTNGTSGQCSYGGQRPRYQLYQTAVSDFFLSTPYNCCFPPSKIQDWFSHQNHGCSATMDLPSNLYHNSNWKGLVLYASFSIQGDSNFILSNLNSGKSHSLYCQCQMSMANVDDQTIAFSTSKEEITWLLELGEFIWISYVPGEPFKNMLQHCSRIEASFVSDWLGVIVQKCALQLLYQHDQIQFEQELKHCNNLISENRELVRKQQQDQKKRNEQYHADEGLKRKIFSNFDFEVKLFPRVIDQLETDETETKLGQSDLLNSDVRMRFGLQTLSVSRPRDYIFGLDLPLKELKIELKKKEEQVLLLTAPGGFGKTTLVKMLCWDDEIKGIYGDNIFFVHVSKHPNLKLVVQNLYGRAHEFPNDEDAIKQLEQHLNEIASNESNPILMILDDVWPESESIIDKFKFHIPDYKIVVTSRTAFPKFKSKYNLKPLDHEDAMRLFRHHSAYLHDESSYIPEEYIEKLVRGCGGLPIALKMIGGSLRGRPVNVWQSTSMRWSEDGHSIFKSDKEVLAHLKKSLEFSDEKSILKEYFMDLGSFPEDQRIPATALIDMWTELHEPNQNDVEVTLHELTTRNLASLEMKRTNVSAVSNYYNEDFVTQHDVLRDLAIYLSSQKPITERERLIVDISGNKLPKWWMKQEQQLINARLLSISTDELFSSSWCNIQAPKVEALVLNFQTRNYTLPEFLEKMVELKVIIITNYGFFPAELSNFQLLKSLPNLKRIRLEKASIFSLFNAPVPLRSVKKISLFMCNIGQAFGNSTIQVSDSLPSLMEINIDYCNDLVELPTWLCQVLSLEKLSITNCHKLSALPEGIGNLVNLEVLRFRSCTELSELPESIRILHKLRILDISDCLSIIELPKHIGELHNLEELHMKHCLQLRKQLPPSTVDLKQLKLVVCDEERAKLWEPIQESFSGLKVMVAKEDINWKWLQINDF